MSYLLIRDHQSLLQANQQVKRLTDNKLSSKDEFALKEKCNAAGKAMYENDTTTYNVVGLSTISDTAYHFNKKLNTCLYSYTINFVKDNSMPNFPYTIRVIDSLTDKVLLSFTQNAFEKQEEASKRREEFDVQFNMLFSE